MGEAKLPRGSLKLAADALEEARAGVAILDSPAAAKIALTAALEVIQRDALKRAARHIFLLEALAKGWRCPSCHGEPASAPHLLEGRTGYTCGCGHSWEPPPPRQINYGMEPRFLLKRLARGEPLPELPPPVPEGQQPLLDA